MSDVHPSDVLARVVLLLNVGSGELHRYLVFEGIKFKCEECNTDQLVAYKDGIEPGEAVALARAEGIDLCGHCFVDQE